MVMLGDNTGQLLGGSSNVLGGITSVGQAIATADAAKTAQQPHSNPISGNLGNLNKIGKVAEALTPVKDAVNSFGTNFGLSGTGVQYTGSGIANPLPWQTAGADTGLSASAAAGTVGAPTLSGVLGAAGTGFAGGSLIGGWLGGNSTVGGFAGAALGAAGYAGLGASIGIAAGPVGLVAGTIAGGVLGGLMGGGKTPHPTSTWVDGKLGEDGSIGGSVYRNKHISKTVGQSIETDFSKYMKEQAVKYGIKYSTLPITGGFSNKKGVIGISSNVDYWGTPEGANKSISKRTNNDTFNKWEFDPKDNDAKKTAYEDAWKYAVTASGLNPASLKAVHPTTAGEVRVKRVSGPSQWDTFLADYRQKHSPQA